MFIRTRYLIKKHKNQLMFCKLQQATLNFFHIIFFNNLYSKSSFMKELIFEILVGACKSFAPFIKVIKNIN